jgi:hypothetical protein
VTVIIIQLWEEDMNRYVHDFLALRHYSRSNPVTCSLISGTPDNFFTVKLNDALDLYNDVLKGDPVTFGKYSKEKGTKIIGGFVLSKAEENEITVSPDMNTFDYERRHHTRYPVSIFSYIKYGTAKEKVSPAWIKDISYEGLRICSASDLTVEDSIEVNICISSRVFNIEGVVVRKKVLYGRNEYGVQITFKHKSLVFTTREYVDNLISHEKKLIENHLQSLMD